MEERDGRKFVDSKPLNNDFDLTLESPPRDWFSLLNILRVCAINETSQRISLSPFLSRPCFFV